MNGAYCELPQLIQQRYSGEQLNLSRHQRALSLSTGSSKSNFRGRGIDFEEVRGYQPGDDIRTIDWRVTARTGTPHTKIFREERERPVLIVTDQRNRMFFGSRQQFKSVLACRCSALLAWAALKQGDRIGGLVFSDTEHQEVRPKRSRRSVLSLLSNLSQYNRGLPTGSTTPASESFSQALIELRRIARPGSSIYFVSDLCGAESDSALEHLYQLSRHTEISALHCSDPLEAELPEVGLYRVSNGSQETDLFTGNKLLRQQYREVYQSQLHHRQSEFGKLGIPLITLSTTDDPLNPLQPYYGGKQRRQIHR